MENKRGSIFINNLKKDTRYYNSILKIYYRLKLYYVRAMYTIEMSILFPIIIFNVFGGIFIAFYTHDMTVTRTESSKCCNESVGLELTITDLEKKIKDTVLKHLILGKVTDVRVLRKREQLNITINMSYDMLFWNLKKAETINIIINEVNCPNYIRKVQVIAEELENIIQ